MENTDFGWLNRPASEWRVGFIGAGRVGSAIAILMQRAGYKVAAVASRHVEHYDALAAELGDTGLWRGSPTEVFAAADLTFITTPDDVIAPLAGSIGRAGLGLGKAVAHTSGALSSAALAGVREHGALVGSLHPLQAFASTALALARLPGSSMAIEGDAALLPALTRIAEDIGGKPMLIRPQDKALYHAAAVLAANYSVTLAALGVQLLAALGIDPETGLTALLPLLRGNIENLEQLGLPAALTGPIARGDRGTVARHLQALDEANPEIARLYRELGLLTLPLAQGKGLDARQLNALHALFAAPPAPASDELYDEAAIASAM